MKKYNYEINLVAFYLSKFGKDNLKFKTWTSAFDYIGKLFGKSPNYIKNRRDVFDAINITSPRVGWKVELSRNDHKLAERANTYTETKLEYLVRQILKKKIELGELVMPKKDKPCVRLGYLNAYEVLERYIDKEQWHETERWEEHKQMLQDVLHDFAYCVQHTKACEMLIEAEEQRQEAFDLILI